MTVAILIGVAILLSVVAVGIKRQRDERIAATQAKADAYTGEVEARQERSRQFREGVRAKYAAAHAAPTQTAVSDADD
jgi:hypothetical protein